MLRRQGVVIGEQHIQLEFAGPFQGLAGRDAVVHGDQQPDALLRQPLHHRRVEAIAVVLPAGDGSHRGGAEPLQHPHQQGRAGHAIGVVVAADGHGLPGLAGLLQAPHGALEIGEMAGGIWRRGWVEQGLDRLGTGEAAPLQYRQQRITQPQLLQAGLELNGAGQLPALLVGGGEQRAGCNCGNSAGQTGC
jgi:hypothetical protein